MHLAPPVTSTRIAPKASRGRARTSCCRSAETATGGSRRRPRQCTGGDARATRRPVAIVVTMTEQLALTIVFEPGEDGWVIASIPEVAGVFSQGRTREEARANVIDALRLTLSPEP